MSAVCSVERCERQASTRGWCRAHYNRWYATGDVRADVPLRGARGVCSVESCERMADSHGLCKAHAERLRRGDVQADKYLRGPNGRIPGRFHDLLPQGYWSDVSLLDPWMLLGCVVVCEQDGMTLGPVWTASQAAMSIHDHHIRAHHPVGVVYE